MAREQFSLFKDWNRIYWKDTLKLNFVRAICVTPVVFIIVLIPVIAGETSPTSLLIPLLWPVLYFVFVPVIFLFFALISIILGDDWEWLIIFFVGLSSLFVISLGDPLVLFLRSKRPDLIPGVDNFNWINFKFIIFVYEKKNRGNSEGEMMDSDY